MHRLEQVGQITEDLLDWLKIWAVGRKPQRKDARYHNPRARFRRVDGCVVHKEDTPIGLECPRKPRDELFHPWKQPCEEDEPVIRVLLRGSGCRLAVDDARLVEYGHHGGSSEDVLCGVRKAVISHPANPPTTPAPHVASILVRLVN